MENLQTSLVNPTVGPSAHNGCPQAQSTLLSLPTELRLHILGYLLPDRVSFPIRPDHARSHPYIKLDNRTTDRDWATFRTLQKVRANSKQQPDILGALDIYMGTRMNMEPSYPEVMRANRQLYQESIDLIWGSSERQIEAKLDKDGLRVLSRLYKASLDDQNLPHLGSVLRNVKSIRLDIWNQDYQTWSSRVLVNVLGTALLDNKCLTKLSITFRFPLISLDQDSFISTRAEKTVTRLLRPFHNLMFMQVKFHIYIKEDHGNGWRPGRIDADLGHCRKKLRDLLQRFHDGTPRKRPDQSIYASRLLLNNFLQYMDDLSRLFPGARWPPYSGYIANSAMLLQRAFKAYQVGDVDAFMKVLDDTEIRYLHEHAHGLASLDKMRWALEDKAAPVQENRTAYGDQWQIDDLPTNEHMSAHERYCDNFWHALKLRR